MKNIENKDLLYICRSEVCDVIGSLIELGDNLNLEIEHNVSLDKNFIGRSAFIAREVDKLIVELMEFRGFIK
jgi:ferritin-like metal-binding protein YciE